MDSASQNEPARGRVLVADDEPHIRRVLVTLLESAGFRVDAVTDGEAALELLEGSVRYDLALLDLVMPGRTGLEVLTATRQLPHRSELSVMILTAKGQERDRDAAFEEGASAFVTKPFSPKKLLGRVDALLRRERSVSPEDVPGTGG